GSSGNVFTEFADHAAAVAADAARNGRPCSDGCIGRHFLIWCTPGAVHVDPGRGDVPAVAADRASALRDAGYRAPTTASRPECWPAPTTLNPDPRSYRER
ncbi:MAG TPA: hypothetical protein VMU34_16795, partial [Mycobacterium sp.]|nr:hypothetical protein [Mycobacterium sp.]